MKAGDYPRFLRQDLEVACEDFSNIIGSSPDSVVYKGTMKGCPNRCNFGPVIQPCGRFAFLIRELFLEMACLGNLTKAQVVLWPVSRNTKAAALEGKQTNVVIDYILKVIMMSRSF